jgi:hypothetical protein
MHLLTSALAPTFDAFNTFMLEGHLPEPQDHLCVRFDANVHVHAPSFWASAAWIATSTTGSCVPRCLAAVVAQVISAGKSVALLRAHRHTSEVVIADLTSITAADHITAKCGTHRKRCMLHVLLTQIPADHCMRRFAEVL